MRTGLVLSTGIIGVSFLVVVIVMAIVLKVKFSTIRPQTKKAMRFFIFFYSITAFICLLGSGLGFLDLFSIPILWTITFIPIPISLY